LVNSRFGSIGPSIVPVDFGEINLRLAVADATNEKFEIGRIVVDCHDALISFEVTDFLRKSLIVGLTSIA